MKATADGDPMAFCALAVVCGAADPDLFIRTGGERRISNLRCGSWRTELFLPIRCGPILTSLNSPVHWPGLLDVSAGSAGPVNRSAIRQRRRPDRPCHE